ncbi:MAG: hypothetical protein QXO70_04985 [Candidatus Pacearchaeota archaeon]
MQKTVNQFSKEELQVLIQVLENTSTQNLTTAQKLIELRDKISRILTF